MENKNIRNCKFPVADTGHGLLKVAGEFSPWDIEMAARCVDQEVLAESLMTFTRLLMVELYNTLSFLTLSNLPLSTGTKTTQGHHSTVLCSCYQVATKTTSQQLPNPKEFTHT